MDSRDINSFVVVRLINVVNVDKASSVVDTPA